MNKTLWLLLLILLSVKSKAQYQIGYARQMRAVWVSTVKMLDYPSARNLSSAELKTEYIRLLDTLHALGINTIIFQVRPAADAFYPSPYEPWSEWLTGKQGRAPKPYFDPLKFFITQAHKRHIQFHAWINPFRAIATIQYADVIPQHISKTHKKWCFDYGINRYFNPGIPQVRNYIVAVIADLVRRYDIDGIHFDDYFYPYPIRDEKNHLVPIPDYRTYRKYGKGFKSIKQWRRHNITEFIKQVHDTIKAIKPYIIFGISPNAVWRNSTKDPRGSHTQGLAAYDWLYADVLQWDSLRLVDYIAPQLYFPIGNKYADFRTLLSWWSKNIKNANLFIGLNLLGIDTTGKLTPWFKPSELSRQLTMTLKDTAVKGVFLYRSRAIEHNPFGYDDTLRKRFFTSWALSPKFPFADTLPPAPPKLRQLRTKDTIKLAWSYQQDTTAADDSIAFYSVYIFRVTDTSIVRDTVLLTDKPELKVIFRHRLFQRKQMYFVQICAWDRFDNQSAPSKPVGIKIPPSGYKVEYKRFIF